MESVILKFILAMFQAVLCILATITCQNTEEILVVACCYLSAWNLAPNTVFNNTAKFSKGFKVFHDICKHEGESVRRLFKTRAIVQLLAGILGFPFAK